MAARTVSRTKNEKKEVYRKAIADARSKFRERLNSLPPEVAVDLEELFKLHAAATDPQEKAEIAGTIDELLVPGTLLVKLEKQFLLETEDDSVRKRLTAYHKSVAKEIKKLRLAADLSQEGLAKLAGIPQSHVCRLETGVHVPTHQTVERIAKALGVSASQIDPGFESEELD